MARKARGRDLLEQAKGCLSKAKTVEELRQFQAVVMPLEFGLSMEQTARAIGVSTGWACQLRNRFIREGVIPRKDKPLRGGRRRENMSLEEEKAFLAPFFDRAKEGGILVAGEIKNALDQRLGRNVALASAYNLLHRHDWRKLAPDKRHPKSDADAQDVWKKNFQTLLPKPGKPGREKDRSG
jgi:transposase